MNWFNIWVYFVPFKCSMKQNIIFPSLDGLRSNVFLVLNKMHFFFSFSKINWYLAINEPLANISQTHRSSNSEGFCKKRVLKILVKFTKKDLYQSLFWHRCFPVNLAKFLSTFFYRTHPVADSSFWLTPSKHCS